MLILLQQANRKVVPFLNYSWSCSFVTEMEMLGCPSITNLEKLKTQLLLDDCTILPFNDDIKYVAIKIKQSRKVKLPDAITAATSIYYNLPLLTSDKGFENIPDLTVISIT